MTARTFKHSGDMGDIIYSLPAVKALGGGVLYLDVEGGSDEPFVSNQSITRTSRFNLQAYQTVRPLLIEQPFIEDVRIWNKEAVKFNLDSVRPMLTGSGMTNLATLYLRRFGLSEALADAPWLTLKSPPIKLHKDIIVNRTLRYQSKYIIWELKKKLWVHRAIFIGSEDEHRYFEYTFDCKVDYHKTKDALEIAQVLTGAHQLIANQSLVMSIAIGLGTSYLQEVYMDVPNCMYKRENAEYF